MKDTEAKPIGSHRERIEELEVRVLQLENELQNLNRAIGIVCEQTGARNYLDEPRER